MTPQPLVEFYRLVPQTRMPRRADRSGAGFLPSRAMRYCDALTSATGYGYWIFPPITMRLLWDGEQILWSFGEEEDWLPVSQSATGSIQFPDFSQRFDSIAPEFLTGYSPPFLTALPEYGAVQIWTGLLAKTRPGWSLNVRQPINLPPSPALAAWEGIVETDIWFGPLFNNFRLTKTDTPVILRQNVPFLQVQPIPQAAYRDDELNNFQCREAEDLCETDWRALSRVLLPNPDWEARQGEYAVAVRKRRLCPVSHAPSASTEGAALQPKPRSS